MSQISWIAAEQNEKAVGSQVTKEKTDTLDFIKFKKLLSFQR